MRRNNRIRAALLLAAAAVLAFSAASAGTMTDHFSILYSDAGTIRELPTALASASENGVYTDGPLASLSFQEFLDTGEYELPEVTAQGGPLFQLLCDDTVLDFQADVTFYRAEETGFVRVVSTNGEPVAADDLLPGDYLLKIDVRASAGEDFYGGAAFLHVAVPGSENRVWPSPGPAAVPEREEGDPDEKILRRLVDFFGCWSRNDLDGMLELCADDWKAQEENPRTALFVLLANRTPKDLTPESISGPEAGDSRTVSVVTRIDRNNGTAVKPYRLNIILVKENGDWHVDPRSLLVFEVLEGTGETPAPQATQAPEEPPRTDGADTVLYYNPAGGEKYHLDPNCPVVHWKYHPLTYHFTYGQVNDEPYSALQPCEVCGAPKR